MLTKHESRQGDKSATALAADVLLWIAGDEDRFLPFLAATGLGPDTLRAGAEDPGFLAGVLDHVMGDEGVLLACAGALGVKPEAIVAAWQRLSPPPGDAWA